MLSLETWQRLLATEAPDNRLGPLVQGIRAGLVSETDVSQWSGLTDTEKERAKSVAISPALSSAPTIHELERPLFALGQTECLVRPLVGIVGTRAASSYGKMVASHFARIVATAGCTVVSGGAIGIDSTAHTAALDADGLTACVLPCGVDVAYPARHARLFSRIRDRGCLLSSFACGAQCSDHRLMARNRLVAALSLALIVIEAPAGSGALLTAGHARDLGRPVFVVPGPVTQDSFRGSHELIRQGATICDDPRQVLAELSIEPVAAESTASRLSGDELAVHSALGGLPKSPETIGHETGMSVTAVLSALTMLEIEGIVARSDNGYALKI